MKNNFRNVRVFEKIFKEFLPAGFAGVCRQPGRDEEDDASDIVLRRKIRQRKETICKRYVVMLCNNSISIIYEKNKPQTSQSFSFH